MSAPARFEASPAVAEGLPTGGSSAGAEGLLSGAEGLLARAGAVAGEIPREPARDLARRELSRPEYHRDDPSLLQRLLEWIGERLRSFIDSFDTGSPSEDFSYAVLVVLGVVLAAVVAIVWWRTGGVQRVRARRTALLPDHVTTAADHRAAAERYAAAGAWAEAIREALRAIARDLEDRAILTARPGRTADEMATEAAGALPDHADELRAAARLFDEVWYGRRPGDENGYRRLAALDERLRAARPVPLSARAAQPVGVGGDR